MFLNRPRSLAVVRIRASREPTPPRPLAGRGEVDPVAHEVDLLRKAVPVPAPVRALGLALAAVPVVVLRAAGVHRLAVRPVPVRARAGQVLDRAGVLDLGDDSSMNFFEATMAIGQAETLDFETAELLIRVENSGDVLYNALADRLNNEEAAELLRKNGREEVGHARRMMKVLTLKTGTEYVPSAEVLEKFEVDLPDSIDASALPMIVKGELQGDIGYQKWAAAETDPEVIELLLRNGREETKHAERVKQAIAILEAAEASQ